MMKLGKRLNYFWFYIISIVFAVVEGYLLIFALNSGKNKTRNIVLLIPLIVLIISLIPKMRIQTIIGFLLLLFWIPAGFDNWNLYAFEILLYAILVLIILEILTSEDEKMKTSLKNVPWIPFLLYILSALLAWSLSTKIGGELDQIRVMCIIPLVLGIIFSYTIQSTQDADRYLWMLLTSAAILGLLFLIGKYFTGFINLSNYAVGSGRLSMKLIIPYLGSLEMLPQSTANWFGYLFVFAYSIWIFHPSFKHRAYAIFLCTLFGIIIISTQGRGGILQAALGAAIVSVYTAINRKIFTIKGIWIKFSIVCLLIFGGFWYLATNSTNQYFYQRGMSSITDPLNDPSLLYRFKGWLEGIELFLENPIFGIGLSGIQTPWGPDTSEILNFFLLNLLGYGLLGFTGLILILRKLLIAYWTGIQTGDRTIRAMCIASIGGMFGFFLGMQPEEPYSIVIMWAPLLIAYFVSKLHRNQLVMESEQVMTSN